MPSLGPGRPVIVQSCPEAVGMDRLRRVEPDGHGRILGPRPSALSSTQTSVWPGVHVHDFYVQSAVVEATRLISALDYSPASRLVDVGCGVARLATGLLADRGDQVDYLGIESTRECCRDNVERRHPGFRFTHLDVVSELYNPSGTRGWGCLTPSG